MNRILLTCTLIGLATPALLEDDDRAAVEAAVADYVVAIEEARPELIERSVHPDLQKFGFHRAGPGDDYRRIPLDYAGLVDIAATFKEKGWVPADATHSIEVFEVLDKTAAAKLTAFWGIDYMHLAKYDGRWKIVQVLWQSPPLPAADEPDARGGE